MIYARNCLTFVKTTAIAYEQNLKAVGNFLPICNSSRFYKQEITSIRILKEKIIIAELRFSRVRTS